MEPTVSSKKYKIKFTIVKQWPGAQYDLKQETEICVRILRVDSQNICVEFSKVKGDQAHFIETFQEYRDNTLNWSNNTTLENKEKNRAQES